MYSNGDLCPQCGAYQLPKVDADSICTARVCQACGWVEELKPKEQEKPQDA